MPSVLAIAAHPDDIEIMMAGTLLLLKKQGWDIHYFNLANGNCGSQVMNSEETALTRLAEAQAAATLLGATFYPPVVNDLEITYRIELLRQVAAVVRTCGPDIVLTHALADYMEDHMATARLAVTAAFAHSIPNFLTSPPLPPHPQQGPVALYHALPHGLHDGLRRPQKPELIVDISSVAEKKRAALALHTSQQQWLSATQGMNSYLATMEETGQQVGSQISVAFGEGWNRHLHLGLSPTEHCPLSDALGAMCRILPSTF